MSTSGNLANGLAYLPNWMQDTKETGAFESLLVGWVNALNWKSVGMFLPTIGPQGTAILAKQSGVETLTQEPIEARDVIATLQDGSPTVVWQVHGTSGRLYTLISPAGRGTGLLWVERASAEPWSEADRNYFRLAARLIEKSSALGQKIGGLLDPERLQQRLADASVIAGRMAHDFDNILTGIIGFSDLTMPMLHANTQPAKFVSEINKVGHRGIVFTQQLHQLSRSGQAKPLPGSIPVALTKEDARIRAALEPGVSLSLMIASGLPAVAIDTAMLQVVIGHVMDNAAEATKAGGTVTVSARAIELNASEAKSFLGQVGPGAHVELTVQDTGSGIKPEVRARLFVEPFYTTKVRHRGLGLAIVYRTLFAHRGGIRIDTPPAPEIGTVVRVVLPLAAARSAIVSPATVGLQTFGGLL